MDKMDKTAKLDIIAQFANEVRSQAKSKCCLKISMSEFFIFKKEGAGFHLADGIDWANAITTNSEFDLILGDLPLGLNREDCDFRGINLKIRRNWIELMSALKLLKADGIAIFLVEPTAFSSNEGIKFENTLNSEGYFINAFFNAPQGVLLPLTSITPVFALITTQKSNSVFVAELLNEAQSMEAVKNFFSGIDGGDMKHGMKIPLNSFQSFHRIKIKQQIEKLETQYKEYDDYTIGELAIEINYVKSGEKLKEEDNSIYIPKIGNSPVMSKISEAKLKHHNYFQIVLGDKVNNEYLSTFFRSALGRLILESLTSETFISHLNKKDLEQAPVALPAIRDQEKILDTQRKLYDLKKYIDVFDMELALNPNGSNEILGQLDDMLNAIGGLTEIDKIRGILRQGESKNIEYKQTLSLDVKKKTREIYIELSVLKTVVAFLNTEGGTLLVGVDDAGNIIGLDDEIYKFHKNNLDKFLLHFKNRIKERIGEEYYPFIDHKAVQVDEKCILLIECKESQSPCYLDNADFYVRTNPATDKLEGPKLVEYVKNHFNQ